MNLPSSEGGVVTQEVGYFDMPASEVARWLVEGLDESWTVVPAGWTRLADAIRTLTPVPVLNRYAMVNIDSWCVLMNNGPRGTDVGLLPSQAARELGCRAIRAVDVTASSRSYAARILQIYGPDGAAPLLCRRSIVAANDGGRWVFDSSGEPFSFEEVENYRRRRIADRFTSDLLHDYLEALSVPRGVEPSWPSAVIVQRST